MTVNGATGWSLSVSGRWVWLALCLFLGGLVTGCGSEEPEAPVTPTVKVDAEKSSLVVDQEVQVVSYMEQFVTIVVQVVSTEGRPVLGASVELIVEDQARQRQTFPLGRTNERGLAGIRLASAYLGTLTLSAQVTKNGVRTNLKQKPQLTFVPGPPRNLFFEGNTYVSTIAGAAVPGPIIVLARDAFGNVVPRPYDITLSLAAGSTASRLEGRLTVPLEGGRAVFSGFRILGAGSATLVASTPGANDAVGQSFGVSPAHPVALRFVTADLPDSVPAGTVLSPDPSVELVDAFGNRAEPLSGSIPVQLLLQSGTGARMPLAAPRGAVFSYPATFLGVSLRRAGEGFRLVATSPSLQETVGTPFTVLAGPADAHASSLSATPARVIAGEAAQTSLRVQLLDVGGNAVPDAEVRLSVSGEGRTLDPSGGVGRTDARGVFTATLTSSTPGVAQVTATAGGLDLRTDVSFVPAGTVTTALGALPMQGASRPGGALLTVDWDGDGDLDAASTDGVLYDNTGDGTLVARDADADRAPGVLAAGDLDGDGTPDLLTAGHPVSVRFNRGDGSLFPPRPVSWEPDWVGMPVGAWVLDLDGDGRRDVAYATGCGLDACVLNVLRNEGGGLFGPVVQTPLGEGSAPVLVSRGPKGGADVLMLRDRGYGGVRQFRASPDGHFIEGVGPTLEEARTYLNQADVDGDGLEDVLVSSDWNLYVLRNEGQGTFASPAAIDVRTSVRSAAVVDLDGDGRRDLVFTVASSSGGLFLMRAQAGGGFSPREQVALPVPIEGVSTADLTGDGRPELLVSSMSGAFPLLNRGDGTFVTPLERLSRSGGAPPLVGDFTGDGVKDVISLDRGLGLLLAQGQPDGTSTEYFISASSALLDLAAADMDGDGRLDLVASGPSQSEVLVLRNSGEGRTFTPRKLSLIQTPGKLAVGDLDGDGAPDVVVLHPEAGTASVLRNDGAGTLAPGATLTVGGAPDALALADLDHDGELDLVVARSSDGTLHRFLNDGRGALVHEASLPTGHASRGLGVADLDGDALPELVVTHPGTGTLTVLSGGGAPARSFPVGGAPGAIAAGDFNGDGRLDLAVANEGARRVGLLLGQEDGFSPHQWQAGLDVPGALVAHDWNQDGRMDLLVSHATGVDVLVSTPVR